MILLALGFGSLAQAEPAALTADAAESSVTYHLTHKLHKVEAISKKVDGKAQLSEDGNARVALRVPVESFDSGNVNRDAHMKETLEAARYPMVELKAIAAGIVPPPRFPTTEKRAFKAQLVFHGETKVFELPVEMTWESPTRVRAVSTFNVSLDAYKVERPSLMFVKVDDTLEIQAKLLFHP
jgi:polyisoprenoid-binding protein YceI